MKYHTQEDSLTHLLHALRQRKKANQKINIFLGSVIAIALVIAFTTTAISPTKKITAPGVVTTHQPEQDSDPIPKPVEQSFDDWADSANLAIAKLSDGRVLILPDLN